MVIACLFNYSNSMGHKQRIVGQEIASLMELNKLKEAC